MRSLDSSAQALKICDPRVKLKLFNRMVFVADKGMKLGTYLMCLYIWRIENDDEDFGISVFTADFLGWRFR